MAYNVNVTWVYGDPPNRSRWSSGNELLKEEYFGAGESAIEIMGMYLDARGGIPPSDNIAVRDGQDEYLELAIAEWNAKHGH